MLIEIAQSGWAQSLLDDAPFADEWTALWDRCPWATAFQSHGFARAWYSTYHREYEPVLIFSRGEGGRLQGLLALARAPDGAFIVAGGKHAEYHAWISEPEIGDLFPAQAVRLLREKGCRGRLCFDILAPGAPRNWTSTAELNRLCVMRSRSRPIIRLGDGRELKASFKKSHNRQKLRQLRELGPVSLDRVTDSREFSQLFDEIACLYDLRHGAMHGTLPFCTIPHQKEFHLAMMNTPGLFYATALRVGGRLAAAQFGTVGKRELHMGTIVHDQALAKYSPGRLSTLMLAERLVGEGFEKLDLTPGNDRYKTHLANDAEDVFSLAIYPSRLGALRATAIKRVKKLGRRGCELFGKSPVQMRLHACNVVHALHPARIAHTVGSLLTIPMRTRVYVARPIDSHVLELNKHVRRDFLPDLLAYQPTKTDASRQQFLSKVLQWIEEGRHIYTLSDSWRLLQLASVLQRPSLEQFCRLLPGVPYHPHSLIVCDTQTFGRDSRRERLGLLLNRILSDAAGISQELIAFLTIPAGDAGARAQVQRCGFSPVEDVDRFTTANKAPAGASDEAASGLPGWRSEGAEPVHSNSAAE